jgi:glycosyltransferase involved in cell wall biosynthesis
MNARSPRLLVLSSLFPSPAQPVAGAFIKERMFRVARHVPLVVLAPQAWFPLQGVIRRFRPHFRPMAPVFEVMDGIEVHRPRFLSFPGILKRADGWFMAVGCYLTAQRLLRRHRLNVLDVHFGYPDGYAGSLLKRWLGLPMVLTLRGKEERQARMDIAAPLRRGMQGADRVVAVSDALRELALGFGVDAGRITVIGNGVDLEKFRPIARAEARVALGLPAQARILVSVGGLVERKGFHRVIGCLPTLRVRHPDLQYLIVGGPGPEGDIGAQLRSQVRSLGLEGCVRFLGSYPPDRLRVPLSAADVFALATRYEGWANVFLEAMSCGLPVVTTRVGGNSQVVRTPDVGSLVEFGDQEALVHTIDEALERNWDRASIIDYARSNAWEKRIPALLQLFDDVLARSSQESP